jgi:DNA-binding NarL/FixJ family response regulator
VRHAAPSRVGWPQKLFQNGHMNQEQDITNTAPIRILSVDDHPLFREGIGAIINCQPDMSLVGAASNGTEAIETFRSLRPHVTLMDLCLPDLGGIDVMISIRAEFPDAHVIILTTFEHDVEIQRALKAGARGYLLKSMPPQRMLETIRQVHAGKKPVPPEIASQLAEHLSDEQLTSRELDVLRHVTEGNRSRDIAERLFLSEHTVKMHIKHIMGKLGARDRTHAIAIAARRGFIHL